MNIIMENKDYKELVEDMIKNKIKVDLLLTDPPNW